MKGRTLSMLALASMLGSAPGGAIERLVRIGRRSLAAKARRRNGRKRLNIATGPGSISAQAEFDQLVWADRDAEAEDLARKHFDACGEVLHLPARAWRS